MSPDPGTEPLSDEQIAAAVPAHPTAEQVRDARDDPKSVNLLYHDWEANSYDENSRSPMTNGV